MYGYGKIGDEISTIYLGGGYDITRIQMSDTQDSDGIYATSHNITGSRVPITGETVCTALGKSEPSIAEPSPTIGRATSCLSAGASSTAAIPAISRLSRATAAAPSKSQGRAMCTGTTRSRELCGYESGTAGTAETLFRAQNRP